MLFKLGKQNLGFISLKMLEPEKRIVYDKFLHHRHFPYKLTELLYRVHSHLKEYQNLISFPWTFLPNATQQQPENYTSWKNLTNNIF